MTPDELDAALLAAHDSRDAALIAALYAEAGAQEASLGEHEAACFFWTQGYVWALEAGSPLAEHLHARLKAAGREA